MKDNDRNRWSDLWMLSFFGPGFQPKACHGRKAVQGDKCRGRGFVAPPPSTQTAKRRDADRLGASALSKSVVEPTTSTIYLLCKSYKVQSAWYLALYPSDIQLYRACTTIVAAPLSNRQTSFWPLDLVQWKGYENTRCAAPLLASTLLTEPTRRMNRIWNIRAT